MFNNFSIKPKGGAMEQYFDLSWEKFGRWFVSSRLEKGGYIEYVSFSSDEADFYDRVDIVGGPFFPKVLKLLNKDSRTKFYHFIMKEITNDNN